MVKFVNVDVGVRGKFLLEVASENKDLVLATLNGPERCTLNLNVCFELENLPLLRTVSLRLHIHALNLMNEALDEVHLVVLLILLRVEERPFAALFS